MTGDESLILCDMKIKLPVTWEMCGWVEVESPDLETAVKTFDPDEHDLPSESEYLDGSFVLTSNDPETIAVMTP